MEAERRHMPGKGHSVSKREAKGSSCTGTAEQPGGSSPGGREWGRGRAQRPKGRLVLEAMGSEET